MINISILGYGTVGSGVFEIIRDNKSIITERTGQEIHVKYVLDLRDFPNDPVSDVLVHEFSEIENDTDVQIVVETMGGLHPAYEFVKASLSKGKSVCTSNKALVAAFGSELLEIAAKNKCSFLFEASVGGGIPIIRPLTTSLGQEEIEGISGILNGTTNYILTEMTEKGSDFDTVLKDAQEKGYAEKDPTADVEGYDACRKIAILASLAYGEAVDFEDIYTEGITKITDRDINYAKKLNSKIKITASVKKENDRVSAAVAPKIISSSHPLYSVDGVFNAILVKGNMVGDVMFYGQGAGKLATASAVIADVVEAAKNIGTNTGIFWKPDKMKLVKFEENISKFFVRVSGDGKDNEEKVKKVFGQVTNVDVGYNDEYGFITEPMAEGEFAKAAEEIGNVINKIRLEI